MRTSEEASRKLLAGVSAIGVRHAERLRVIHEMEEQWGDGDANAGCVNAGQRVKGIAQNGSEEENN